VRWLHNNEAASGPRYESLSDGPVHALHIHGLVADDAGTLTVIASNSLGTASHSAKVSVDSTTASRRRQPVEHEQQRPVNGFAGPTTSQRHWDPAASHSPRSSDTEHPVSPAQLKMMSGT